MSRGIIEHSAAPRALLATRHIPRSLYPVEYSDGYFKVPFRRGWVKGRGFAKSTWKSFDFTDILSPVPFFPL